MRAPNGSRLRLVTLSLSLMVGGGPLAGCHKQPPVGQPAQGQAQGPAPDPEAVKQSYAALKKEFADMQQSFTDLSKDLESIPPDLPGYPQLRAVFYATEESRGVTDAKKTILGDRLDSALRSGKPDDLRQVAAAIEDTHNTGRKIGEQYLQLLHQVMAFQRVGDQRKEALAAANAAAHPAKTKHSKSK
ncbi:MAG TPA: hypothetical protein VMT03_03170 [Polyangia bacterium]|nr:hypothetical protein [Polyangia bacterium]